ncbi:MAG TPA: hypothetical protein VKB35_14255, partial [Ktedonobacteraceae bacterium]|nr:hypothetical protein [Ktedonobacteraceae bacterium]
QAAYCFPDSAERTWLVISGSLGQGLLLCRLRTLAHEFSLHIRTLASRDGTHDGALFMRASTAFEA